jgi:hypothetical protein
MRENLFQAKIKKLSSEKLEQLLKLKYEENSHVIELALQEVRYRSPEFIFHIKKEPSITKQPGNKDLKKWNWAAFLLAPLWTFSHKLDTIGLLTLLPGINFPVMLYLGIKGNKIGYDKSNLATVSEFLIVQKQWTIGLLKILLVVCTAIAIITIIEFFT